MPSVMTMRCLRGGEYRLRAYGWRARGEDLDVVGHGVALPTRRYKQHRWHACAAYAWSKDGAEPSPVAFSLLTKSSRAARCQCAHMSGASSVP